MQAGDTYSRVTDTEHVAAFASSGDDRATFYGTAGDEALNVVAGDYELSGDWGLRQAENFDWTHTILTSGGTDTVSLVGTVGDDTLLGNFDWLNLYGAGYSHFC